MTSSNSESTPLVAGNTNDDTNDGSSIESKIASIRDLMAETHASRANYQYKWRLDQLRRLQRMVDEHWSEWLDALHQDLGKEVTEAAVIEMAALLEELAYLKAHCWKFMQPKDVPSPGVLFPVQSKVQPMPLKPPAVLVIGPSNYPVSISFMAVAGSLACGNPTVLKPSELCPACTALMAKYIPQYFEPNVLQVVLGGVNETTALLELDWGTIHFTGSERVGKIVAAAAAKTLTPTILELGGKCPCLVDETCPRDMRQIANRILWGKTLNCGQNCISPDYLLVHESKADELVQHLTQTLELQFGDNPQHSELGRLVAPSHVKRAIELLEDVEKRTTQKGSNIQILSGGARKCNAKTGYVAPTLVFHAPLDCRLMQEEIFGPIFPILVVKTREEAIDIINSRPGTPLGLYVFTSSDRVFEEMTQRCRSGTAVRNDNLIQFGGPFLPFGGLGTSGIGTYRGEYSFRAFSQDLPIMTRPVFPGADINMLRYHPFAGAKGWLLRNVAIRYMPAIPNLKPLRHLVVVGLLAWGLMSFGPEAWVQSCRLGLASVLQQVVHALRGGL